MNKTTRAWSARNGSVVTYQTGEEKPDLPPPSNTSGMQRPKFTGQTNYVTPGPGANFWGQPTKAKRRRKRKTKPDGVVYRTESGR